MKPSDGIGGVRGASGMASEKRQRGGPPTDVEATAGHTHPPARLSARRRLHPYGTIASYHTHFTSSSAPMRTLASRTYNTGTCQDIIAFWLRHNE